MSILGLLLLTGGWLLGATRAFFTSRESIERQLVRLIDSTHHSVDMALFRFSSRPLAQALSRARARGVSIRVVLDGHPESDPLPLSLAAGEVRRLDGVGGAQGIMHHKFVLLDGQMLVTGSFNWTAGAEHRNYENALLTDDAEAVNAYRQEFERLWSRALPMQDNGLFRPLHLRGGQQTPWFSSSSKPSPPVHRKRRRKSRRSK